MSKTGDEYRKNLGKSKNIGAVLNPKGKSLTGQNGEDTFERSRPKFGDLTGIGKNYKDEPLPEIFVRDPNTPLLKGQISENHLPADQEFILGSPAEKAAMAAYDIINPDFGGAMTTVLNDYKLRNNMITPEEALQDQILATSLGAVPFLPKLVKGGKAIKNTVKTIPFSDQTAIGQLKRMLAGGNKPVAQTVTADNAIKNTIAEGRKLGEKTSHKIIAPVLKEQPGRFPTITKRNTKTGMDSTYKLDQKTGKYVKDKEMTPDEMFRYRAEELRNVLKNNGYDMTPGGEFINESGKLTDKAWLTPVGKTHMPYLYDTDTYLHISPNKIARGDSFRPDMRTKNEAFWTDRGGDLGEGAYGTHLDDLSRTNFETSEPVYKYNLNTYNRLHPLVYENYYYGPSKKYLYEGEQSLYSQSPFMRYLVNSIGRDLELGADDMRHLNTVMEPQYELEKHMDPMNINTLLDRKYGIPGNTGWGQTAIGGEDLNTFIRESNRVPVTESSKVMADGNYIDYNTGIIYNGVTKQPQLTYPKNEPLIMDNEEMNYLKSLGMKDISRMHEQTNGVIK